METRSRTYARYSKRAMHQVVNHDASDAEFEDLTPRRTYKMAKRPKVEDCRFNDGYQPSKTSEQPNFQIHRGPRYARGFIMPPSPGLIALEQRGNGFYGAMDQDASVQGALEEYRQLAHSQFRRIYYDLSRGIAMQNDGVGFLFKYATNDISTSTYGMYGEIRPSGLQRICKEMERFGLDSKSVIVDLGSGRGMPNIMFAHQKRVFASVGIEMCPVSYALSVNNLLHYLKLDTTRCILNSTDIGKTFKKAYNSDCHYWRAKESDETEGDSNHATCTPTNTRLSMHLSEKNDKEPEDNPNTAGSVATHYDEGTLEVGESTETPTREIGDDGEYYRALARFSTVPSSLGLGFCNEDISAFNNYNGASHIYSFDIAMEKALVNNIVRQFTATKTAWLFASFNADLIERFDLRDCFLAAKIPCQMYKSGEHRCCYIYVKNDWENIKRNYDSIIAALLENANAESEITLDTHSFNAQIYAMDSSQTSGNAKKEGHSLPNNGNGPNTPAAVYGEPSPKEPGREKASTCDVQLSRFNEPVNIIELIKLAKMPIGAQIGWYMKKMHRSHSIMTRSKGHNAISALKSRFCHYRGQLMERIATTINEKDVQGYAEMLKDHISNTYMAVHSLPNPPTWL